jgi:large subunit ribosomal protein L35
MSKKMKSKSAATKRFKLTARGKLKFKKAGMAHKLSKKSRDQKRPKKNDGIVTNADRSLILNSLAYHK